MVLFSGKSRAGAGGLALFCCVLFIFSACPTPTDGGDDNPVIITIANTTQWEGALSRIKTGGNGKTYELIIAGSFGVPPSAAPSFGTAFGITVTLKGSGTLSLSSDDTLFFIYGSSSTKGQTLIIDGDITLKGRADNSSNGWMVIVDDYGSLWLKEGTITENGGGGVYVTGGNFYMPGGEISDNEAATGGGVYVDSGSFIMSENGKISNNTATNGGGVYVASGGYFRMEGGEISGNTANGSPNGYGGGVYVTGPGGYFIMTGGEISTNTGSDGGGVGVGPGGYFTMTGGEISTNTATNGGGVYVTGGSFYMPGGEIRDNTATSGGGVYVFGVNNTIFIKTEGTIYGNDPVHKNIATSGNGHAVYAAGDKEHNVDADPSVTLSATYNGSWTYGDTAPNWVP
jgi:hypothetical protein